MGSYNNLIKSHEEEKKMAPAPISNKGSMSTAKSSSGPGGLNFGDLAASAQFDFMNQKYINNQFD